MKARVKKLFLEIFNYKSTDTFYSPGRVNIIGGHTDYNGGAVLPFCINFGIYGASALRNDQIINIYSDNLSEFGVVKINLDDLEYQDSRGYANYASGVLSKLKENGYMINKGFDLAIIGNLPIDGGLSSSAALSILIATIVKKVNNLNIDNIKISKICQQVENEYIGVSCGIMDQFIIANGKKDTAIYLETNTLNYEYISFKMEKYKFVLINSNITRRLVESKYNLRQQETRTILEILQQYINIEYICDLLPSDYIKYERYIKKPELKRRFKHLVDEQYRVKQAKIALEANDFFKLGELLYKAHVSARDLYEISGKVIDNIVELGMKSGSLGSKMIGGGFGGSTLNIVETNNIRKFIKKFTILFKNKYKSDPKINIVEVCDGVGEI